MLYCVYYSAILLEFLIRLSVHFLYFSELFSIFLLVFFDDRFSADFFAAFNGVTYLNYIQLGIEKYIFDPLTSIFCQNVWRLFTLYAVSFRVDSIPATVTVCSFLSSI